MRRSLQGRWRKTMSVLKRLALVTAVLLVLAAIATRLSYRSEANDMDAALLTPAAESATDRTIRDAQARVTALPDNAGALDQLAYAYLQRARETADSTFYGSAEGLFQKSLSLRSDDQAALIGLSSVSLSRHDFAKARDFAQRAVDSGPETPAAFGALGDAQMELGQYDEAVVSYQQMVNLRPDLNSYVRVSYAREIHGNIGGAVQAMQLAVEAAGPTGENAAWVRMQLGNLYFNSGRLADADAQYTHSLQAFPGYVHAIAGRARVAAANGNFGRAEDLYDRAVKRMPVVQYVVALGDVYQLDGKPEEARRQYDLVGAISQLAQANGVNTDLEIALFDADHDLNSTDAVRQAQAVYEAAPSIPSADVLAWALFKSGDATSARKYIEEALRVGTKDAAIHYHAGLIYKALGNTDAARSDLEKANAVNPHFSPLQAPIAQQALAELGG
jgi:tetratricopeptide (TPR) repeat protein